MHRIVPEAMDQAFELVSMGTEAEGAGLDLVLVPITVACRVPGCGRVTESEEPLATCPACGGADLDLEGGDELLLESIELAPGEPALSEGSAHVPGHPG